jgi:hypothetical protein
MIEENKKELINQLEQATGNKTIFLEKFGENICWVFNTEHGEQALAITKDSLKGQIIMSLNSLEAILNKAKQTNN